MSEADLEADIAAMLRLRDGDDLALNELMTRWQEPLVRFLYRYTVSEQDALDLALAAEAQVAGQLFVGGAHAFDGARADRVEHPGLLARHADHASPP